MATVSSALPAIDETGSRRRTTALLSGIGLVCGLSGSLLVLGVLVVELLWGHYPSEEPWIWPFTFVAGLTLATGAVVAGVAVFRRARPGVETPSRNKALLGMSFGGFALVFLCMFAFALVEAQAILTNWLSDVLRNSPASR